MIFMQNSSLSAKMVAIFSCSGKEKGTDWRLYLMSHRTFEKSLYTSAKFGTSASNWVIAEDNGFSKFTTASLTFQKSSSKIVFFTSFAKVLFSDIPDTASFRRTTLFFCTLFKQVTTDLGVARIFDWGVPNHKSHAMTSSEIFEKVIFYGAKIS